VGRLAQGLQAAETGGYYIIGKKEKQIKKTNNSTYPRANPRMLVDPRGRVKDEKKASG